jgi:cobalamin biosynthesis protein CbiG
VYTAEKSCGVSASPSASLANIFWINIRKSPQIVNLKKILARVFFLQYLRVHAVHKLYSHDANFCCIFKLDDILYLC